jgi:hypothetical protein
MTPFFLKGVPSYWLNRFIAVRNTFDNFSNVLQVCEILNVCFKQDMIGSENNFDIAIFSGDHCRILVKKADGYFSMAIPFQIIDHGERISFNCDDIDEEVDGRFISIMRNAIETSCGNFFSHEDIILSLTENYNLEVHEAVKYYDAFAGLVSDDHGYFRFDDDPHPDRMNGDIHPRYHFDIFFKNTTSIKIGYDSFADIACFYSLVDSEKPKEYLGR